MYLKIQEHCWAISLPSHFFIYWNILFSRVFGSQGKYGDKETLAVLCEQNNCRDWIWTEMEQDKN